MPAKDCSAILEGPKPLVEPKIMVLSKFYFAIFRKFMYPLATKSNRDASEEIT